MRVRECTCLCVCTRAITVVLLSKLYSSSTETIRLIRDGIVVVVVVVVMKFPHSRTQTHDLTEIPPEFLRPQTPALQGFRNTGGGVEGGPGKTEVEGWGVGGGKGRG